VERQELMTLSIINDTLETAAIDRYRRCCPATILEILQWPCEIDEIAQRAIHLSVDIMRVRAKEKADVNKHSVGVIG